MAQKRTRRRTERRERPRAEARLSMRLEGDAEGQIAQIVTESQNVSASGVYCTSSRYLAPLSKLAMTIVLPNPPGGGGGKELIKCEGIVVRCQPSPRKNEKAFELACMFSGLDARRRALIEEFVAWRNLQALRAAAGTARNPRRRDAGTPRPARKTAARGTGARRRAAR